jgi:hypothetical protein
MLRRYFESLTMKENESVEAFITRVQNIMMVVNVLPDSLHQFID